MGPIDDMQVKDKTARKINFIQFCNALDEIARRKASGAGVAVWRLWGVWAQVSLLQQVPSSQPFSPCTKGQQMLFAA